jgi:uncharacterized membrane protein required for colicin V production
MHVFDICFGVVTLVLIFLGLRRGFIDEVMRLTAIVVGFIGALALYRQLVPKLSFLSHSPHIVIVVSFLVIFFCIALGVVCIGTLLKKMVRLTMMGWLDHLCGACIGAVKAFFLGWIFVITVSSIPVAVVHYFFKDSPTYAFFVAISPALKAQVVGRVPSPQGAFSRFPLLNDFWKKLLPAREGRDSVRVKAPSKKSHLIEGKK